MGKDNTGLGTLDGSEGQYLPLLQWWLAETSRGGRKGRPTWTGRENGYLFWKRRRLSPGCNKKGDAYGYHGVE